MRVAWVGEDRDLDRIQPLAKRLDLDSFMVLASPKKSVGAGDPYLKDGERYVPLNKVLPTLEEIDPDVVVLLTRAESVAREMDGIVKKFVTGYRADFNLSEVLYMPEYAPSLSESVGEAMSTDFMVCGTEATLDQMESVIKPTYSNLEVEYIPIYVEGPDDSPECREPSLLTIGEIESYRNHLAVVQASNMIIEEVPDTELTIYGDGSLTPLIVKLLKRTPLENLSRIVKPEDAEFEDILSESRLVLNPHLCYGGDFLIHKAMAWGRPVVMGDNAGSKSFRSMIRVKHDRPDEIASAVVELLRNEGEYEEASREARQEASDLSEEAVRKWPEFLERIHDERRELKSR